MKALSTALLATLVLMSGASSANPQEGLVAHVSYELLETVRGERSLIFSGTISTPIDNAAIITEVKATDFNVQNVQAASEGIASVARETAYVAGYESREVVGESGKAEKVLAIVPGKVVEGTRASVWASQVEGEPLVATITMDIRRLVKMSKAASPNGPIQLPDVSQQTFSLSLREGENTHQVGGYTMIATLSAKPGEQSTKFSKTKR